MHFNNVMKNLKKLSIAVVFGGFSKERPGSLVSGQAVFESLKRQRYKVFAIDPQDNDIYNKLKGANVVFLALHGRYGEDGKMQGFLETLRIPYTGSGVLSSALGMDKQFFKRFLETNGLPTLKYEHIDVEKNIKREADRVIKALALPLFIKPVSEGGSLGCAVIRKKQGLVKHIINNLKEGYDSFLVEKYIKGRCFTVGILEMEGHLKALSVLETISLKEFYDYEAKHNPSYRIYECPAKLPQNIYKKIQQLATKTYKLLKCHGFCRVDFLLDRNKPYILEVNTLPGLSSMSNMAVMAKASGISYDELIVCLLKTAFTKPNYLP